MDGGRCSECGAEVPEPLRALPEPITKQILRSSAVILISAAGGFLTWGASPAVLGQIEPWDGQSLYYSTCMFLAGLLGAAAYPRLFWLALIGASLGQSLYHFIFPVYPPSDPLILPICCGAAIFGGLQVLVGAALAWAINRFLKRSHR